MTRQYFIDNINYWSELLEFCSDEDCDVCEDIYSEDARDDCIDEKTQEGNLLPVKHCVANTHGWEIALDIACAMYNAQHHIEYFRKDTFGSYDLGIYLARQNKYQPIDEVVLVGLCTDICVISNALLIKAFLPEVKITVDASCCAGVSPESHENALRAMKMCQINIENWEG